MIFARLSHAGDILLIGILFVSVNHRDQYVSTSNTFADPQQSATGTGFSSSARSAQNNKKLLVPSRRSLLDCPVNSASLNDSIWDLVIQMCPAAHKPTTCLVP